MRFEATRWLPATRSVVASLMRPPTVLATSPTIMDVPSASEITALLRVWGGGNRQALDEVMPVVYRQLQGTARRYMARQGPGHLLQSTALVNETYMRLAKLGEIDWQDRGHFFAVCAQLMRQILTDYARSRLYLKRGGQMRQVPFDHAHSVPGRDSAEDLIALDDLLRELSAFDERMSRVVQYRVFVGATIEETAAALCISERTVKREWQAAKAWLARELDRRKPDGA
jgi:RNA polymerase sigma factor (TIGR02999 family)